MRAALQAVPYFFNCQTHFGTLDIAWTCIKLLGTYSNINPLPVILENLFVNHTRTRFLTPNGSRIPRMWPCEAPFDPTLWSIAAYTYTWHLCQVLCSQYWLQRKKSVIISCTYSCPRALPVCASRLGLFECGWNENSMHANTPVLMNTPGLHTIAGLTCLKVTDSSCGLPNQKLLRLLFLESTEIQEVQDLKSVP